MKREGKYIENIGCSECGSSDAVGVYQRDDGSYYGICFSCNHFHNSPYGIMDDRQDVEEGEEDFEPVSSSNNHSTFNIANASFNALPSRSLSLDTCRKYGVKSIVDSNGNDLAHYYPHSTNDDREVWCQRIVEGKKFSWIGSPKDVKFFGQDVVGSGGKMIIVTEGACFPSDTEVLTLNKGWVKLEDYTDEEVAQVSTTLEITYTRPLAVVDKLFTGNLIDRSNSKGLSEIVTEDHNVARLYKGKLVKKRADDYTEKHLLIPRVAKRLSDIDGVPDDLVRLMVAIQSDGCIRNSRYVDFHLKKQRKIDRLQKIIIDLGLTYKIYYHKDTTVTVRCYIENVDTDFIVKSIKISTLLNKLSNHNLVVFIDEVKYWDGNSVKNRNQDEFNNRDKDTIDSVQLASHLLGFCSTIRQNESGGYTVSILYSKNTSSQIRNPNIIPVKNKRVMCLSVPDGYLLVRQNDNIFISGNCDTLAVYEMLKKCGKSYRVVSIVNGAAAASKDFKTNFEWINSFEQIFLAFDQDGPGQAATKKVAELFPPNKVKTVVWKGAKDPNELLLSGLHQEFLAAIYGAKETKPDGIVSVDDIFQEAITPPVMGLSWPWKTLTEVTYGYRRGELYGIGAGSGCGKTEFFKECIHHTIYTHELKAGVIFLEEPAAKTLKVLAGKRVNKRFHIPADKGGDWTIEELVDGINDLKGKVYLYNHFGAKDWESIKSKIRFMVNALDIKDIYLDHLTALVAQEDNEYKALNKLMEEMSSLCQELDCTIFYVSHLRKASGTPHEEGGRVTADQFKGSGAIVFWSNFLIGLERNQQAEDEEERNTTTLRVLKDRNTGLATGTTFKLKYDHETGRWGEIDEDEFQSEF